MWVLLLILWPIAEVFVAFEVAKAVGFLLMVLLIIASWPIGSWAMRSQGRVAMRHLRQALADGRPPADSVLEGALVLAGGILLIIPGFITDAFGLLLLFPPTRAVANRLAASRLVNSRFARFGGFSGRGRGGARQDFDVEGTASDVDSDRPRLST